MATTNACDVMKATMVVAFVAMQVMLFDVNGAKILFLSVQQPSQVILKLELASELIKNGHEVYYALTSKYPKKDALLKAGIKIVEYPEAPNVIYPYTAEWEDIIQETIFNRYEKLGAEVKVLSKTLTADCSAIMNNKAYLENLKALKFDIAVVSPFILNPCLLLVPNYLRIPHVSAAAFIFPFTMGLPALPSFYVMLTPSPVVANIPTLTTFSERLINTVKLFGAKLFFLDKIWGDTTLLEKYAPGIDSWEQLVRRSEIIIIENDHHLDVALPLLPHVVTAGGSTATPPKPLPDNLEKIMEDSGEHGVILASFGSSAYNMPAQMATKFLEAYGRLKETVLTKMAVPPGVKVPSNVHMLPWQPQNDILGHPKTKLFVTHCGSSSQNEALFHGMPMLGIPMFAEQGWNCGRVERKGIALCLDLMTFTADDLYNNIRELIDNPKYRTKIAKLSAIVRDEPMSGSQKAAFWVNHVIKHGGSHLRSPALEQPVYQLLMLDILGFLLLVFVVVVAVVIFTVKALLRKFRKNDGKKKYE